VTPSNEKTDFLSVKEFSIKVGLHHNTVRKLIKNGRLSAVNVGNNKNSYFRIPKSEIGRLAIDNHVRWTEIQKLCE
jgi:excisionase family DNA binding protein